MPGTKLQQQWKQRNHAILEPTKPRKQEEEEEKRHHPPPKKTTQAELTQYIAAHHEMPEEETELNRDDRKQLAELMLEYPRRKQSRTFPTRRNTAREKEIYMPQLQPTLHLNDRKVQPHQAIPRMPKCESARNL